MNIKPKLPNNNVEKIIFAASYAYSNDGGDDVDGEDSLVMVNSAPLNSNGNISFSSDYKATKKIEAPSLLPEELEEDKRE